ncbi:DUF4097 domain-containing protein [Nocardia sp. NBC_01499]|uniref:DUF4097 family beta strand repeat-containing protein n=1 Tax=Nocardia sp. NBC_01499 TaxID=2903597 RepID=UPI00386C9D6F
MPTFDTPEPIAVTLVAGSAEVRLAASARTDTVVRVEPGNKANGTDVKLAENVTTNFSAGQLSVTAPGGSGERSAIIVTIELPVDSGLTAKLANAQVHASGSLGAIDVRMDAGLVQLDSIGTLQARLSAGDLVVGHITGAAEIGGSAGSVRINEADGNVRFRSSDGQIWIGDAADDLDLSTVNGGIELGSAGGNVTAKTVDGAIRVGRLTHGRADLMNSDGNIEIGISEGTAAWVDASSTKGSVHSALPAHTNPDEFDSTVKVRARTQSGDIVVRRAADGSA